MPVSRANAIIPVVVALLAACGKPDNLAGAGVATHTHRGDTLVVHSEGDGIWGPVHDAVEVLRVAETSEQTTFGQIALIRATPDGGVIVYDVKALQGLVLRQFSPDGRFIRNIGRAGSGPGEYEDELLTLTVRPTGSVLLFQFLRGKVSTFSPDGRYLSGFVHPNGGGNLLIAGTDGSIFVRGSPARRKPGEQRARLITYAQEIPVLRYDSTGLLFDSIAPPRPAPGVHIDVPPIFALVPTFIWFPVPDGRVLVGRTDWVGFQIIDPKGSRPPTEAERPVPSIVYANEERREHQAAQDWDETHGGLVENGKTLGPGSKAVVVPKAKMPVRSIDLDVDGRVWIDRATPSTKIPGRTAGPAPGGSYRLSYGEQERLSSVFQLDGTFLGDIRFPAPPRGPYLRTFAGNVAWGIVRGEDGTPILVKYRLH
jgi:hypothetical protein